MTRKQSFVLSFVASASASLVATAALAGAGLDAGLRRFSADLTGAAEVPGPGDADGKGKAILELDPAHDRLCYKLRVEGIDEATMAHIIKGAAGVAGVAASKLEPPAKGASGDCIQIAPELTQGLMKKASDYYVNVHNAAYPNGALRGQLK
jgi:hypothetical protein